MPAVVCTIAAVGVGKGVDMGVVAGVVERGVGAVARGANVRGADGATSSTKPGGNAGPVLPTAIAAVGVAMGVDMGVEAGVVERGVVENTVESGASERGAEDTTCWNPCASGCQGCVDMAAPTKPGGNAGPI